jgi:Carboxypeptidase regulatory-like domain
VRSKLNVVQRPPGRQFSICSLCRLALLLLLNSLVLAIPALPADVVGVVTNAQGGEPLAKIQVALLGRSITTITGPEGKFHFSQLPAGSYVLQVSGVGYRSFQVSFQLESPEEAKEIAISLAPENFRRTERVEVSGDVFEPKDWPAVGDLTLTSSELRETATVLADDPFRSLQALPGVSPSANNDFHAQFSVMGASFAQVGVYVDDVFVPNVLHTVPDTPDAPNLSLFTGNDVEDIRLMPVAYPVRYADDIGAALAIRTRAGSPEALHFHGSAGLAYSEILGEGGFGSGHKGTWLVDARKSYIGYLVNLVGGTRFSRDGFYDGDLKLTYNLTPAQTFSFLVTGGRLSIDDPNLPPTSPPTELRKGLNDLAIGRLGWRWTPSSNLVLDVYGAYVSTRFEQDNAAAQLIQKSRDFEWSNGINFSWSWNRQAILQSGYSLRRPSQSLASNNFDAGPTPVLFSFQFSDLRQDAYIQQSVQLCKDRLRLEGGLRWSKLNTLRVQPFSGQSSVTLRLAPNTQLEAGWAQYAQLPVRGGIEVATLAGSGVGVGSLPLSSSHFLLAVEQRLGERSRFRVEAFDRQNQNRSDVYSVPTLTSRPVLFRSSALLGRDYSRGLQFLLQRRSENRLSGWIGYTLTFAKYRTYEILLPPPLSVGFDQPYGPTLEDQRHTANIFGSYRLTPSVRLSGKAFYGSGFPAMAFLAGLPLIRLGPYERLDLRADKSWSLRKGRINLYGEILNVTNHSNPTFSFLLFNAPPAPPTVVTNPGLPFTPTAGVSFDF